MGGVRLASSRSAQPVECGQTPHSLQPQSPPPFLSNVCYDIPAKAKRPDAVNVAGASHRQERCISMPATPIYIPQDRTVLAALLLPQSDIRHCGNRLTFTQRLKADPAVLASEIDLVIDRLIHAD